MGTVGLEPVYAGRREPVAGRRRSEAEHVLDLVPQHEDQYERQRDQHDAGGDEPELRPSALSAVLDTRAAAGTMKTVRMLDRRRVERRLVLGGSGGSAGGLGHRAGF